MDIIEDLIIIIQGRRTTSVWESYAGLESSLKDCHHLHNANGMGPNEQAFTLGEFSRSRRDTRVLTTVGFRNVEPM